MCNLVIILAYYHTHEQYVIEKEGNTCAHE